MDEIMNSIINYCSINGNLINNTKVVILGTKKAVPMEPTWGMEGACCEEACMQEALVNLRICTGPLFPLRTPYLPTRKCQIVIIHYLERSSTRLRHSVLSLLGNAINGASFYFYKSNFIKILFK